jgi:hypothetical protein
MPRRRRFGTCGRDLDLRTAVLRRSGEIASGQGAINQRANQARGLGPDHETKMGKARAELKVTLNVDRLVLYLLIALFKIFGF